MSCARQLPYKEMILEPFASTDRFVPYTDWMLMTGLDKVQIVMNIAKLNGNFSGQAAWQTAEIRTDKPSTTITGMNTAVTDAGRHFYEQDLTGAGSEKNQENLWVRFGVKFDANGATNSGYAQVGLNVSYERCGRVAGSMSNRELTTYEDGGGSAVSKYKLLTGWLPTLGVGDVFAGIILTNINDGDNLRYRLAYRTAATDRAAPDAWTAIGSLETIGSAVTEVEKFIADTTISFTSKQWVQFALEYVAGDAANEDPGRFVASAVVTTRP